MAGRLPRWYGAGNGNVGGVYGAPAPPRPPADGGFAAAAAASTMAPAIRQQQQQGEFSTAGGKLAQLQQVGHYGVRPPVWGARDDVAFPQAQPPAQYAYDAPQVNNEQGARHVAARLVQDDNARDHSQEEGAQPMDDEPRRDDQAVEGESVAATGAVSKHPVSQEELDRLAALDARIERLLALIGGDWQKLSDLGAGVQDKDGTEEYWQNESVSFAKEAVDEDRLAIMEASRLQLRARLFGVDWKLLHDPSLLDADNPETAMLRTYRVVGVTPDAKDEVDVCDPRSVPDMEMLSTRPAHIDLPIPDFTVTGPPPDAVESGVRVHAGTVLADLLRANAVEWERNGSLDVWTAVKDRNSAYQDHPSPVPGLDVSREASELDHAATTSGSARDVAQSDAVCDEQESAGSLQQLENVELCRWYFKDAVGREHGPKLLSQLRRLLSASDGPVEGMSVYCKPEELYWPLTPNILPSQVPGTIPPQFLALIRARLCDAVLKSARRFILDATVDTALSSWLQSTALAPNASAKRAAANTSQRQLGKFEKETALLPAFGRRHSQTGLDSHSSRMTNGGHVAGALEKPHSRVGEKRVARNSTSSSKDASSVQPEPALPSAVEVIPKSKKSRILEASASDPLFVGQQQQQPLLPSALLQKCFDKLRPDIVSLMRTASTCKSWRKEAMTVAQKWKAVDLSNLGPLCTNSAVRFVRKLYRKKDGRPSELRAVCLKGCSNVDWEPVVDLLQACPSITHMFIDGCPKLRKLPVRVPKLKYRSGDFTTSQSLRKEQRHDKRLPDTAAVRSPRMIAAPMTEDERRMAELVNQYLPQVLTALKKYDERFGHSTFKEPVDDELVPDYYQVIPQPMDLSTMQQKLQSGQYARAEEGALCAFRNDIALMCQNAIRYNGQNTQYYIDAEQMLHFSNEILSKLETRIAAVVYGGRRASRNLDLDILNDIEDDSRAAQFAVAAASARERKAIKSAEQEKAATARARGARMGDMAMAPPTVRKYDTLEDYEIVADFETVDKKMTLCLPENGEPVIQWPAYDMPLIRPAERPKKLGTEVVEQEVYGLDPHNFNCLMDAFPQSSPRPEVEDEQYCFIEQAFAMELNKKTKQFTRSVQPAPPYTDVVPVLEALAKSKEHPPSVSSKARHLERSVAGKDLRAYRKGLGVVCNASGGFKPDEFVVAFLGEIYPPWRWFEKQDAIRQVQKARGLAENSVPEFYNMTLERPKGDAGGYDVLFVDAMHRANYASRFCHSCRPNCETRVAAIGGRYVIGVFTLSEIAPGEELTFNYNSVTESAEEYNSAICLCGTRSCQGSFLHWAGVDTFQQVMMESHGVLDRHHYLLMACNSTSLTPQDHMHLTKAGFGWSILQGLPLWAIKYAALLLGYAHYERTALPGKLLEQPSEEIGGYVYTQESSEIQAEGVLQQRLQNIAIMLDKVKHVLHKLYGEKTPDPPIRQLAHHEVAHRLLLNQDSLVEQLLQSMGTQLKGVPAYQKLCAEVRQRQVAVEQAAEDPVLLRSMLIWLRDEVVKLPVTPQARHDAAADMLHMYAHTKVFFDGHDYQPLESDPIVVRDEDVGVKLRDMPTEPGSVEHNSVGETTTTKTYPPQFIWGQLIYWWTQSIADTGCALSQARRGCLTLPDLSCCYGNAVPKPPRLPYDAKQRNLWILHLRNQPQKQWSVNLHWSYKMKGLYGSPSLDAVIEDRRPINPAVTEWLQDRTHAI
eukprot:jgi/Chlat1/5403/Chrsp35S05223